MPQSPTDGNAEICAATYDERLADFRSGMDEHAKYQRSRNAVMPWFEEHCRWLSNIELVVRMLDFSTFVCDTQRGRPKGLTAEFVLDHQFDSDPPIFMEHATANVACASFDHARQAPVLAFDWSAPGRIRARYLLAAKCWNVRSPECDRGRATLEALDASEPLPAPVPVKPLNQPVVSRPAWMDEVSAQHQREYQEAQERRRRNGLR